MTMKPSRTPALVSALLIAWASTSAASAQPPPGQRPQGPNPIERHLFPPELVIGHQAEIGLGDAQRQSVIEQVQALQSDVVPLQFELGEAVEALSRTLDEPRVDEAAAIAHVERIGAIEARIKRRHLELLIRIKNLLTPEQQQTLRQLRARR